MAFQKPIDQRQFERAKQEYASMRFNLRLLRRDFPPRSDEEVHVLQKYRIAAQSFARELLKPRGRIDVNQLNLMEQRVTVAYLEYLEKRMSF